MSPATIQTPIGPRERASVGETSVPTYFGRLRNGDRAQLVRAGYPQREIRKASGIRPDGRLVVFVGSCYYEVGAPVPKSTTKQKRNAR